jgi:arabinogalactan endo-1,4-beta-galactosidase
VLASGEGLQFTDFDMIGKSFYPFLDPLASIANLESTKINLSATYPESNLLLLKLHSHSQLLHQLAQTQFVTAVASVVKSVSGGVCLFYLKVGWINNAAQGSSFAVIRSSFAVFGQL